MAGLDCLALYVRRYPGFVILDHLAVVRTQPKRPHEPQERDREDGGTDVGEGPVEALGDAPAGE